MTQTTRTETDRIADAIRAATDEPGRHDERDLRRLAASILHDAWDRPAFPFEVYVASYGGTSAEARRMLAAAEQAIDADQAAATAATAEPADSDIYVSRRDTLAGRDLVAEVDREFVAQAWDEWEMVDALNAWMDTHGRRNAWLIDYRGQLEPFDVPAA